MTGAGPALGQQEMFVEPSAAQAASVDKDRYLKSTKKAYVKRHRLVAGIQNSSSEKEQTISLNFFSDAKYKVTISKFEAEGVTNCWMGHVDGLPSSLVELYIEGNSVNGRIDVDGKVFVISGIDGQTLIREVDRDLLPRP